jgi:hypothetical protein
VLDEIPLPESPLNTEDPDGLIDEFVVELEDDPGVSDEFVVGLSEESFIGFEDDLELIDEFVVGFRVDEPVLTDELVVGFSLVSFNDPVVVLELVPVVFCPTLFLSPMDPEVVKSDGDVVSDPIEVLVVPKEELPVDELPEIPFELLPKELPPGLDVVVVPREPVVLVPPLVPPLVCANAELARKRVITLKIYMVLILHLHVMRYL